MTLKYPPKSAILSISARWYSREQKYYFAGYRLLYVNWNCNDGWSFGHGLHLGFGLDIPHLRLKSFTNNLDPTRRLIGFNLGVDVRRLNRIARLASNQELLVNFESKLAVCAANGIDLRNHIDDHNADLCTLSAQKNDAVFIVNKGDEAMAWQAPGSPDLHGLNCYLANRNALIWLTLMRHTLSESEISEALKAYYASYNRRWPTDPMREPRGS